jgi:hypothetical protein
LILGMPGALANMSFNLLIPLPFLLFCRLLLGNSVPKSRKISANQY